MSHTSNKTGWCRDGKIFLRRRCRLLFALKTPDYLVENTFCDGGVEWIYVFVRHDVERVCRRRKNYSLRGFLTRMGRVCIMLSAL